MKKKRIKNLLSVIIFGLLFCILMVQHFPTLNAEIEPVTTSSVSVENGSSILFNEESPMEHYINVYGSGEVTFDVTFDNYNYRANRYSGCMKIQIKDDTITKINVNIIVVGSCSLYGGNHPGLRLPNDTPILLSFYMQEGSEITFGSQDGSRGIRNGNESDNEENIDYALYNVNDPGSLYSLLTSSSGRDSYTFIYSDKGGTFISHTHIADGWTIISEPTCTTPGLRRQICTECGEILDEEEIEPINHHWSDVTYDWDEEMNILTATRICLNDSAHIESESVDIHFNIIEPTCLESGEVIYISDEFNNPAFLAQEKREILEPLGHDLIYHESKPATFDDIGWDEYYTCTHCDYTTYHERPMLERPDMDDPEAAEEFKEMVTQNIIDIVGDSLEDDIIVENIDNTPVEVLADIIEVVSNAYNSINELFVDVPEGEKIQIQPGVRITKEEAYEIIKSVTTSTIIITGGQESQMEMVQEVEQLLPKNSGIDIGGAVASFYERVLNELLSAPAAATNHYDNLSFILHINNELDGIHNNLNTTQGIDYSVSAETYQMAVEFVETSVSNMTDAALRLRECSGEAQKANINHYITGLSVQSFRDFDRAKADAEFAEAAYQAILISLQETVQNTLTENYEKAKANKSGRALQDLTEAYEKEMEQVSHLHFLENISDEECSGCFEDIIIEVMRLKYLTILNNKKEQEEISNELFNEHVNLASDVESFAAVYKDIFFCWATGQETNSEVKITLQELSDAAIESTTAKINPETIDVKIMNVEWVIIGSITGLMVILSALYIFISRKKGV